MFGYIDLTCIHFSGIYGRRFSPERLTDLPSINTLSLGHDTGASCCYQSTHDVRKQEKHTDQTDF